MSRFEDEAFTVAHGRRRTRVPGLAGWRCGACGEVEFDPASAAR